jgi:uncharacterized protein YdeI (BOF family)
MNNQLQALQTQFSNLDYNSQTVDQHQKLIDQQWVILNNLDPENHAEQFEGMIDLAEKIRIRKEGERYKKARAKDKYKLN